MRSRIKDETLIVNSVELKKLFRNRMYEAGITFKDVCYHFKFDYVYMMMSWFNADPADYFKVGSRKPDVESVLKCLESVGIIIKKGVGSFNKLNIVLLPLKFVQVKRVEKHIRKHENAKPYKKYKYKNANKNGKRNDRQRTQKKKSI